MIRILQNISGKDYKSLNYNGKDGNKKAVLGDTEEALRRVKGEGLVKSDSLVDNISWISKGIRVFGLISYYKNKFELSDSKLYNLKSASQVFLHNTHKGFG